MTCVRQVYMCMESITIHNTGVETGATRFERFESRTTSTPGEHSAVGDAPMTGICYHLRVFIQCSLGHLEQWRFPSFPASIHLLFCYLHVHDVRHGVNTDNVPVLNESDRATDLSLWNDVADNETMGAGGMGTLVTTQAAHQNVKGRTRERIAYPPLNRPSVINATSWPSPAPITKLVGFNISGIPIKTEHMDQFPLRFPPTQYLSWSTYQVRPWAPNTALLSPSSRSF